MKNTHMARFVSLTSLASLLLVAGCSETINIQLEPKVDAYVVSASKQKVSLVETDTAYIELQSWLQENQTGWHNTSGRFPGGVYIKSGKRGIQVTGMEIVIYTINGFEPDAQYVRNVGKTELPLVRGITPVNSAAVLER
jgi:hypothetical protein